MSNIVFEKGSFKIKRAEKEDALTIYELIRGIAEYEKMLDEVVNSPEMIKEWLFDKKTAETYIGAEDGRQSRNICGRFICYSRKKRQRIWQIVTCFCSTYCS